MSENNRNKPQNSWRGGENKSANKARGESVRGGITRGESTRGESTRGESTRGESTRRESSRGGSARGDSNWLDRNRDKAKGTREFGNRDKTQYSGRSNKEKTQASRDDYRKETTQNFKGEVRDKGKGARGDSNINKTLYTGKDNREIGQGSRGDSNKEKGQYRGRDNRGETHIPRGNYKGDKTQDYKGDNGRDKVKGAREVSYKDKTGSNNKTDKFTKHRSSNMTKGGCPHIRECGGCNILKQSYELELKEKNKTVEKLLKDYCKVEPIIGMKQPNHYRNKVHVVFDHDRKGNPVSGVYEEGTHRVIPVESCMIHNKKADEIIATIRGMLKSFKIKTYDEDTGYGLLRHVLIRTGFSSGEIMVVLVLSSPILPSKSNFTKALLKQHPEIKTIVLNVNDKKTSMVLGDKENVIYGKGYIEDRLCDKVFRISPKSFYQVNPAQTEVLYGKAIELAQLSGTETVIDAYCGIGTIGLIAADHAKKVIGVELNKDAVKDANINAKRNDTNNIDFYNNDASEFMTQMAAQKETVDLVFMDPPRTGSNEKFMDALSMLKPKKVVYISCNPVTLERDLKYLKTKGFKAITAVPVDMFPWTEHVETVCLLTR